MRKVSLLFAVLAVLLAHGIAHAVDAESFKNIKIVDDILVFVDVDGADVDQTWVKERAMTAFRDTMRGMELNDDAYVENYPAKGYTLENVGYVIMKLMSIRTKGGQNIYHLHFEFGIPPRQVYWDTATMGVAPTTFDFKRELGEDIDEVMQAFATAFYQARGK